MHYTDKFINTVISWFNYASKFRTNRVYVVNYNRRKLRGLIKEGCLVNIWLLINMLLK